MTTLSLITIYLALALALAAPSLGKITYPATIEIDLLFPRNETYSTDLTGFPAVFAVQNAEAAYEYGWLVSWDLVPAGSSNSDVVGNPSASAISDYNPITGSDNEFRYYFGDNVAVIPVPTDFLTLLDPGEWRLDWVYKASPCAGYGLRPGSNLKYTVAEGSVWFSISEESAREFEVLIDECPGYGDSFTVESENHCPANATRSEVESDPCKARLESQEQVDCIWEFVSRGRNDSAVCRGAFEVVDGNWSTGNSVGRGDDDEEEEEQDDEEADNSTDDIDLAMSYRPGLVGLAGAAVAAVAFLL
ncbi:hypothetical protein BJY04DRAFT_223516 [Aspergillus karnatakaensis]|uniref:uncharacterized protein n=1 Tax=Aspergillus karnatakaensis TaxID=1810916 RepID=UPI003CCD367E